MNVTSAIGEWFSSTLSDTWKWFMMLNHQEWLIVLGLVATFGMLCMKGFGSRGSA